MFHRRFEVRDHAQKQLVLVLQMLEDGANFVLCFHVHLVVVLGIDSGGTVPPSKAYVWRNLPLDVGHVLAYFVAHEAHHRGQLVMIARTLGHRLPKAVVDGLWQWTTRSRE